MNSEEKNCQSCLKSFVILPIDFEFYEKMQVPPPTWCPQCRMIRRMGWTSYKYLYRRTCDFSGEQLISSYHPDSPHKIYKPEIWWSDKWDAKEYGKPYDFTRDFFSQFLDLFKEVPLPALHGDYTTLVNSPYCNGVSHLKNCYLCFQTGGDLGVEDSAYTHLLKTSRDCLDMSFATDCESCYDSFRLVRTQQVFYSNNCEDSYNLYFCTDCVGCSDCIGSINMRNKKYCIYNEQYSKEEYEHKKRELLPGSYPVVQELRKSAAEFALTQPHRAFRGVKNQNTSGDYIYRSNDVQNSYMVDGGEHVYNTQLMYETSRNVSDQTLFGINCEFVYESCWVGLSVNMLKFCFWNYYAHHLEYSFGCHSSENLFGCVGVRKGAYCILNKQYSKEEYLELLPKIKEQMMTMPHVDAMGRQYKYGEFFPPASSPWSYDESIASDFLNLSNDEARGMGFLVREPDEREYKPATAEIPANIQDVTDSILDATLACETCGKNYRLIPMELKFYRKHMIPVPRTCFFCRDKARINRLNPIEIHDRTCGKCGVGIQTSYSPDRPEIVYCETCYQNEVA